jgi:cytochrome c oxidase subunit 3
VATKTANKVSSIHPKKFALWMAMGSIVMLFAGLTSGYIVRKAAGNWYEFQIPNLFYYSTAAIIASSISLHLSYRSFLNGKVSAYRWFLVVAFLCGWAFLAFQYAGWRQLNETGIFLTTNVSSSFLFAIVAMHALHILGGLAAILVTTIMAFKLPYKLNPIRQLRFELTLTYWHFVDVIWLYLLVFLFLQ